MSVQADRAWQHVGSTSNAEFYRIEDDVLAVLPHDSSHDDGQTARASLEFQDRYWTERGHRGAVVVFMDNVLAQDADARRVYASETARRLSTCFALVGETFYGQAVSAVFTGLSRPGIPTRIFPSLAEARPWLAEMNAAHGRRL